MERGVDTTTTVRFSYYQILKNVVNRFNFLYFIVYLVTTVQFNPLLTVT